MIERIAYFNVKTVLFVCLFFTACGKFLNKSSLEISSDTQLISTKGYLNNYYEMLEKRKYLFAYCVKMVEEMIRLLTQYHYCLGKYLY